MQGLADGISEADSKAIDAMKAAVEKVLDKVHSQASSFRGTIGGFSGFSDVAGQFGSETFGGNSSAILQAQVGGASQLADVLEALKRQGAARRCSASMEVPEK